MHTEEHNKRNNVLYEYALNEARFNLNILNHKEKYDEFLNRIRSKTKNFGEQKKLYLLLDETCRLALLETEKSFGDRDVFLNLVDILGLSIVKIHKAFRKSPDFIYNTQEVESKFIIDEK